MKNLKHQYVQIAFFRSKYACWVNGVSQTGCNEHCSSVVFFGSWAQTSPDIRLDYDRTQSIFDGVSSIFQTIGISNLDGICGEFPNFFGTRVTFLLLLKTKTKHWRKTFTKFVCVDEVDGMTQWLSEFILIQDFISTCCPKIATELIIFQPKATDNSGQ